MDGQNAGQLPDIIIVGGGIVGCALAYDLTAYGLSVLLLDRQEIAREASWASAGIIVPPDPASGSRIDMTVHGYRRYPGLVAEVEEASGIRTGFNRTGQLIAAEPDDTGRLNDIQSLLDQHGIEVSLVEGEALRELEPALSDRYAAGLLTSQTASIRLDRLCAGLASVAATRGATVLEHVTVTGVLAENGAVTGVQTTEGPIRGSAVVVAAGAWSGDILQSLDVSIPTFPVRGQVLEIRNAPVQVRHVISAGGGHIVPRADGSIVVAATVEPEAGFDTSVTLDGVQELLDLVQRVAPELRGGTLGATWAGLRPASGDGDMIIGRLPHLDNLWIATGHFRNGAVLGPATSEWLAKSIVRGEVIEELAPYNPARFL